MLTWFQPQHIIHCRSFRFVFDLRDKFSSTWLRSRMAQTSSWLFRSFFLSNRVWTEPLTARGIYNQLEKYLKQDASVVSFCQQVAAQVPSRLSNFYIVRIHQFANNSRTRDAEKKNKRRFKILKILGTFYVFLTKYKNQILFNQRGEVRRNQEVLLKFAILPNVKSIQDSQKIWCKPWCKIIPCSGKLTLFHFHRTSLLPPSITANFIGKIL